MSDDVRLPPEIDAAVEDKNDKELLRRVALGQDFENFIKGPLGRFLLSRGESERADLLEQLVTLDPEADRWAIRKVQKRIAAIDTWQGWCAEAINDGILAEREFIVRNQN